MRTGWQGAQLQRFMSLLSGLTLSQDTTKLLVSQREKIKPKETLAFVLNVSVQQERQSWGFEQGTWDLWMWSRNGVTVAIVTLWIREDCDYREKAIHSVNIQEKIRHWDGERKDSDCKWIAKYALPQIIDEIGLAGNVSKVDNSEHLKVDNQTDSALLLSVESTVEGTSTCKWNVNVKGNKWWFEVWSGEFRNSHLWLGSSDTHLARMRCNHLFFVIFISVALFGEEIKAILYL